MPSYDPISNQMLTLEAYENAFNIQPKKDASPISLVTMNATTDIYTNGILEQTMQKLIACDMYKETGISVMEALNLPTYELKALYCALKKHSSSNAKVNAKLAALLK